MADFFDALLKPLRNCDKVYWRHGNKNRRRKNDRHGLIEGHDRETGEAIIIPNDMFNFEKYGLAASQLEPQGEESEFEVMCAEGDHFMYRRKGSEIGLADFGRLL